MSVRYRIFPEHGLVYVAYEGFALLSDTLETFRKYMQDRAFQPGQKHLVDLTDLTGYEKDYPKILALQAAKAEAFVSHAQTLMVYYAPTRASLELARVAVQSWETLGVVVPVVQRTEADALTVLGIEGIRMKDLKQQVF